MNEDANVELVRSGYEKFGSGDIEGLLSLFSEDIDWSTPHLENAPFGVGILGIEEVSKFFNILGETEDFAYFEPTEFIPSRDKVVVLGRAKSTVKTTGRDYEMDWVHVFTIHEGKVTNFAEYFDTALVDKAFQKAASA